MTPEQITLVRLHATVAGYSSYVETDPGEDWSPDGYGHLYLLTHGIDRISREVGVIAAWSDVEATWLGYFREALILAHEDAQNCRELCHRHPLVG